MTDIKISELSQVSSNTLTDLFEISRSLGSGDWESGSTTYHNLLHSIWGQKVITVGSDGAMATTIEGAIELAQSSHLGAPSSSNPIIILVQPGIYTEVPLTLPSYVSLIAEGDNNTTYVKASTTTSPILTMDSYSTVSGFYFQNANGSGGAAVNGTGTNCVVNSCASSNCETGFWASGSAAMRCIDTAVINTPGQTCIYGFRSDGGSTLTAEQCITNGVSAFSLITYGYYSEGSGSKIIAPTFFAYYCINGLYIDNEGIIDSDSGYIQNCTNAMRIASNGSNSKMIVLASSIESSTTYDVFIESISGHIDFTGSMDYNKRSIASGAEFHSIGIDDANEILKLTGKAHIEEKVDIGVPGDGGGMDAGEGGSYTLDQFGTEIVEYWQYDDSAGPGLKFTRYTDNAGTQLLDEGDAIVVGSKFPFAAVSLSVNIAANVGSNNIIAEHWNGVDWTTDAICTYRKSDMTHRGSTLFQNVESQYVEFDTAINDDWADADDELDNVPDWDGGIDMYPIRFRNNSGALTTAMVFQSGKVRGDDFDIKGDANTTVNWGNFRKTDVDTISITSMEPNAVNPPSNITVDISPNISNVMQANFTDGNVCAATFHQAIPTWADTSSGVTLNIAMYATNDVLGDVNMDVIYLPIDAGFIFDGTATEYSASLIQATYGITGLLFAMTNKFDISSFSPGDAFTISLERDATDGTLDTYVGNIVITGVSMEWTRKLVG